MLSYLAFNSHFNILTPANEQDESKVKGKVDPVLN
jgi:hypothetical protein